MNSVIPSKFKDKTECNMCASQKNIFFLVIFTIIYKNVEAIRPEPPNKQQQQQQQQPEHNARSFRNALNQQGIQSLLQSIENRLGNLDQIYSNRYSQRVDLNTDQYVQKIEMLESKLMRLESTLDAKLEKLLENLSSKNFRDDITKDQIFRKIDSVYERFNHKLSYMEGKFDIAFLKLQNIFDIGATKIERSENTINSKLADMESKITEGVQIIKKVKNNVNSLEEKIMNVTRVSLQNLEKIDATNIVKSLSNIENKFGNISSQNQEECLNNFTKKEPSYYNKINNMYNELWKKSNTIESSIKNSVQILNLTRKEIQDIKEKTTNPNNQNDDNLEYFHNFVQKIDHNFKDIMATQNLFLESCELIQMDATQFGKKIDSVLEELLNILTNRDPVSFKELQNTEEIIKTQSYNMERLINQTTNTVMKLSEKTSEDRKKIEKVLSTGLTSFANFMTMVKHEIDLGKQDKSNIGDLILELQAQVNDLDSKLNEYNMNYNAKQMLQDDKVDDNVLRQTKDTFEKQLNISALHNTINKVDDSVEDIHQLLSDINIKINKYVDIHKLNATSEIKFDCTDKTGKPSHENVDIVFGESDKNTTESIINLFRYNYTVIDDKGNNKSFILMPESTNDSLTSTVSSKINAEQTNINDTDSLLLKLLFPSKEINSTTDAATSLEKPTMDISHYKGNKNKHNYTNNIISIDNSTGNYLTTEISTNNVKLTSRNESSQQNKDNLDADYYNYNLNSHEYDTGEQYPDD